MTLHPLFAAALAPFTPHVDHEAFGRCPHGHVQGRYDVTCLACERARILGERSIKVTAVCACVRDGMPDPNCLLCGGTGECGVAPF